MLFTVSTAVSLSLLISFLSFLLYTLTYMRLLPSQPQFFPEARTELETLVAFLVLQTGTTSTRPEADRIMTSKRSIHCLMISYHEAVYRTLSCHEDFRQKSCTDSEDFEHQIAVSARDRLAVTAPAWCVVTTEWSPPLVTGSDGH